MDIKALVRKFQAILPSDLVAPAALREVIVREAEKLLVAGKVIPTVRIKRPNLEILMPTQEAVVYGPLSPMETAQASAQDWTKIAVEVMDKYEGVIQIPDITALIDEDNITRRIQREKLTRALAEKEDAEILSAIDAGAGNTFAVSTPWNQAGADPVSDILTALDYLSEAPDITDADLSKATFILPFKALNQLRGLQEIHNITTSPLRWLEESYGIRFLGTKQLDTYGYAVIPGELTGRHFVLEAPELHLVEKWRDPDKGMTFIKVRAYFKTYIIPDDPSGTTTKRICKITNLLA